MVFGQESVLPKVLCTNILSPLSAGSIHVGAFLSDTNIVVLLACTY